MSTHRTISVLVALAMTPAWLTGCSSSGPNSSAGTKQQSIVIRTQFTDRDGTVLAGSVLGGAAFCPNGTLHHDDGSPDIGYPAVNVFTCVDGQLKIGFGPGPDQQNKKRQSSGWSVLGGTGRFAGATGSGHMTVKFLEVGGNTGKETFRGTIVLP